MVYQRRKNHKNCFFIQQALPVSRHISITKSVLQAQLSWVLPACILRSDWVLQFDSINFPASFHAAVTPSHTVSIHFRFLRILNSFRMIEKISFMVKFIPFCFVSPFSIGSLVGTITISIKYGGCPIVTKDSVKTMDGA